MYGSKSIITKVCKGGRVTYRICTFLNINMPIIFRGDRIWFRT